jgi:hypothetical protein
MNTLFNPYYLTLTHTIVSLLFYPIIGLDYGEYFIPPVLAGGSICCCKGDLLGFAIFKVMAFLLLRPGAGAILLLLFSAISLECRLEWL